MPVAFSDDIIDFLNAITKWKVKYIIVGGEAVIYYGHARLTGDIDIFFDTEDENVQKLINALKEFWGGVIPGEISKSDLTEPGAVIQFGLPPNRIDLLNSISGVEFDEAWGNKTKTEIFIKNSKIELFYIGINELIKNKKSTGRFKDLDDIKFLKKLIK